MKSIVVVEDEELVRKGIVHAVDWESIDCEVVGEASNGLAGLAVIKEKRPDLIVADIKMPVMERIILAYYTADFHFTTSFHKFQCFSSIFNQLYRIFIQCCGVFGILQYQITRFCKQFVLFTTVNLKKGLAIFRK